jgi:hypothetical protein
MVIRNCTHSDSEGRDVDQVDKKISVPYAEPLKVPHNSPLSSRERGAGNTMSGVSESAVCLNRDIISG